MILPAYVQMCMDRLETAGFAAYAVGGCVRDACLGLTPADWDMCTSALPEQTEAVFQDHPLVLAGKKHGTVGVITPEGVVEITTFRTEGDYADNRHPEWVRFVPEVEADLARRDFTVNAMAYSPTRGFRDPFGGREDLANRVLRAVGDPEARFREDSLRILRGARFAAKYGLVPEQRTLDAMTGQRHLMENLARERVFSELCKLITLADVQDLLRFAPVITAVIPELESQLGFDQRNPHHAWDLFTHTAHVCGGLPQTLPLRWAGLLHDIGKVATFSLGPDGRGHFYGHAQVGRDMAEDILLRLKAPTALREEVTRLVELHMTPLPPEKKVLRRWLSRLGRPTLDALLTLQEADMGSKGTGRSGDDTYFSGIRSILAEIEAEHSCLTLKDLAVNGHTLAALGLRGRQIGEMLQWLLGQVLEEALPNSEDALASAARARHEQGGNAHE